MILGLLIKLLLTIAADEGKDVSPSVRSYVVDGLVLNAWMG